MITIDKTVIKNANRFKALIKYSLNTKDDEKCVELISLSARFAFENPCGILASDEVETKLNSVAETFETELSPVFDARTTLHVISHPYQTGGHTKFCRRWIESIETRKQSVIFTSIPDEDELKEFRRVCSLSGGTVFVLESDFNIGKAKQLRSIASRFEYIVMHTHMDDVVPNLAFGSEKFARPVVFFNHADHLFWLGASISDLVISMRTVAIDLNKSSRGIDRNYLLPILVNDIQEKPNDLEHSREIKRKFNVSENSKVILTIANAEKLKPYDDIDFAKTMQKILKRSENTIVLVIGPSESDSYWKQAFRDSNKKIICLGKLHRDQIDDYIKIADLGINSFPLGSTTSILEIARFNVPCLSLDTPLNQYDLFEEAKIVCRSLDELVERSVEILNSENDTNQLFEILKKTSTKEAFRKSVYEIEKSLPLKHATYAMKNQQVPLSSFERHVVKNYLAQKNDPFIIFKSAIRTLIFISVKLFYPALFTSKIYNFLRSKRIL